MPARRLELARAASSASSSPNSASLPASVSSAVAPARDLALALVELAFDVHVGMQLDQTWLTQVTTHPTHFVIFGFWVDPIQLVLWFWVFHQPRKYESFSKLSVVAGQSNGRRPKDMD